MTKPCKFENGICIYCGDTTRVNSRGETCGGWTETDNSQTLTSALAKIERLTAERNEAQAQAAKSRLFQADVIRLTAERDALKQDAERLDWLEAHKRPAEIYVDGVLHGCNNYGIAATTNHTLRVAIDAAMETTK